MKSIFAELKLTQKIAVLSVLLLLCIVALPHMASAQDLTSITLNWTAPGDDEDAGQAAQYDVRYSTSPITDQNWNSASQAEGEPDPSAAGATESFTVHNLQPNTTYYFAIKTADESENWSGLSNVATVTTIDNVPPANITDLVASGD